VAGWFPFVCLVWFGTLNLQSFDFCNSEFVERVSGAATDFLAYEFFILGFQPRLHLNSWWEVPVFSAIPSIVCPVGPLTQPHRASDLLISRKWVWVLLRMTSLAISSYDSSLTFLWFGLTLILIIRSISTFLLFWPSFKSGLWENFIQSVPSNICSFGNLPLTD